MSDKNWKILADYTLPWAILLCLQKLAFKEESMNNDNNLTLDNGDFEMEENAILGMLRMLKDLSF